MMKGFYRWLDRKLKNQRLEKASLSTRDDQPRPIDQYGLNFNVYRATGGYVIEVRQYDHKNDRNKNSLHIVTEDMDLGAEMSKIIIVETLRS